MKPLVGMVCDRFFVGEHDLHSAKQSYVRALIACARVNPVLIPASRDIESVSDYLDGLSGLLFPGGASNVETRQYGGAADNAMLVDPDRDHVALELMRGAADRGMPLLGICRGFQEMNVAFGGTLHGDIHAAGHSDDHLEDPSEALIMRYRYRHEIELVDHGTLSMLTGGARRVRVNSLIVRAWPRSARDSRWKRAPDGLVEAIRLDGHPFALGVQWHPEAMTASDALSRALFESFGEGCRYYAMSRTE
jgi:putative glutamine amidotransferase